MYSIAVIGVGGNTCNDVILLQCKVWEVTSGIPIAVKGVGGDIWNSDYSKRCGR